MSFFKRLKDGLALGRKRRETNRSVDSLRLKLTALEKEKQRAKARIRRRDREIVDIRASVDELETNLRRDGEAVDRQARTYEHTIEQLRNELQILKDVVVPGLAEANTMWLEMKKAETAVQVLRQVKANPPVEM